MDSWPRGILIVDDDALTTTLLEKVLSGAGFRVASCPDASSARTLMTEFDPDLVILDVNLGNGPTGLQLGFVLARLHPEVALLYLTRYPAAVFTERGMADHVRRHTVLSKDDIHDTDMLVRAIEAALRGRRPQEALTVADDDIAELSPTQLDVLGLVAEGLTNAAIAEHRDTSERAVEKQLRNIYSLLDIESNRVQNARVLAAMRYRHAMGSVKPESERTRRANS